MSTDSAPSTTYDAPRFDELPALTAETLDFEVSLELALATLTPAEKPEESWRAYYPRGMPEKTLQDLQWDDLLQQIAEGAMSPEGVELALALRPLTDERAVARRLNEVRECQALLSERDEPPLRGLSDTRKALAHVERSGSLIGEDLYAIARNCDVASRTARFFRHREQITPHLADAARTLDACDALRETLNRAVEPDGSLSDDASPDLRRLRRAVQNHHDRLRTRVDQMLQDPAMKRHLQDDFFTLREDRYVLPIRSGGKGEVPGIVHAYSSSGRTAFIEPEALVQLNNQLRWAQIELREEEDRILERLSRMVEQFAGPLRRNTRVLAYLDLILASARFAYVTGSQVPTISGTRLELRQARHPLLYLKQLREVDGVLVSDAVPNDLILEEEKRVLVVSGPNTGGKTVLLKTLGLCALMVKCGLPIPVDAHSHVPLFEHIYTDIGDEQSIERDLSTFSGHLTNINTFLDHCGSSSLVLLDELFTGTDPLQGAALAVALLEELTERRSRTVVTTHLESLKTLAFQKDSYANASMGFDIETLSPTYRVTHGLPGSSYAVRIAERLGFPGRIIDRTRRILDGQEHQTVEEILSGLEDRMQELQREQKRLTHARDEAERAKQRFQHKYDKLVSQEKDFVHRQTRELKAELDAAHRKIKATIAALQAADSPETRRATSQAEVEQLRQDLRGAQDTISRASDLTRPVEPGPKGLARIQPDELEVGMEVYAHKFRRKGTVIEYAQGDTDAQLQMGALKVKIGLDELYYTSEAARRRAVRGRPITSRGGFDRKEEEDVPMLLPQTSSNTVDLRGMRVDEALEKMELFLDSAYASNIIGVYIIHGHGTGRLKRAVRGFIPESPYVQTWRHGERTEGGDGVTIAFLKSGDISL